MKKAECNDVAKHLLSLEVNNHISRSVPPSGMLHRRAPQARHKTTFVTSLPVPEAMTVDAATDPNDATRLGWPGGVDPIYLATPVLSSPVLACQLLPPPANPDHERAVQRAIDAVIAVEKNIITTTLLGLYGAYQVGGLPMADWWMAVRLSRPE